MILDRSLKRAPAPKSFDDFQALNQILLGRRVEVLRTSEGWSRRHLAQRANIGDHHYVSDLERGTVNATLQMLGRISGAFGISVRSLLGDLVDWPDPSECDARGPR